MIPQLVLQRSQPILQGVEFAVMSNDLCDHPDRQHHKNANQEKYQQHDEGLHEG